MATTSRFLSLTFVKSINVQISCEDLWNTANISFLLSTNINVSWSGALAYLW